MWDWAQFIQRHGPTAAFMAASATIIAAVVGAWRRYGKRVMGWPMELYETAKAWVGMRGEITALQSSVKVQGDQLTALQGQVGAVIAEFSPNGGASFKDLVSQAVAGMETLTREMVILNKRQVASEERERLIAARLAAHFDDDGQARWRSYPDGRQIRSNDKLIQLLGRSQRDLEGWGWASYIHDDDRDRLLADWRLCLEQVRTFNGVYRFLRGDGDTITARLFARPLLEEGEVLGWEGTAALVTP
jgi:PAS domain S-box-containing protein